MDKKRFNESTELCKHFYQPKYGLIADPKNMNNCFANSTNITLNVDLSSIPIFTNVKLISADQLKFEFHFPASTSTNLSAQIDLSPLKDGQLTNLAANSFIHVEVAKSFENGSKLIYWYLDGSKKIYGRFIAYPRGGKPLECHGPPGRHNIVKILSFI